MQHLSGAGIGQAGALLDVALKEGGGCQRDGGPFSKGRGKQRGGRPGAGGSLRPPVVSGEGPWGNVSILLT